MAKIIIAVGSNNPVKINACKNVAQQVWGDIEVFSFDVKSGVSDQPMNDSEGMLGAINRAKVARQAGDADYGFGLEGTFSEINGYGFTGGWVAIVNRDNRIGIGFGGKVLLPNDITQRIKNGEELGPVLDEVLNKTNISKKEGAIGIFTNNMITRQSSFETGIKYAMAKFVKPELYV